MPQTYEGPNRHELLNLISEYNNHHDTKDHILIPNAGIKESNLDAMRELIKNERCPSDSARQLKYTINELWALRRIQVRKSPVTSLSDWVGVWVAGKKLVEAAEKGMERCNAKAAAVEAQKQERVDQNLAKRFLVPDLRPLPVPRLEVPNQKQNQPLSPQPPKHSPKHEVSKFHPRGSYLESLKKKMQSPNPKENQRTLHEQKARPQRAAESRDRKPKSPEDKARHRKFVIEQKEILAYLEAMKLHSEVRKM